MYLEKLSLHNYRGIRDMEIEFDRHLNVFVGDNGCGKTTVIDAIRKCLNGARLNHVAGTEYEKLQRGLGINSWDVFNKESKSKNVLGFIFKNKFVEVSASSVQDEIGSSLKDEFGRVDSINYLFLPAHRELKFKFSLNNVSSENSKLIDASSLSRVGREKEISKRALEWIKIQEDRENAEFRWHVDEGNDPSSFRLNPKLQAVKKVISKLTSLSRVTYNNELGTFEAVKEVSGIKEKLRFEQLSLGEQVFLGLAAAIACSVVEHASDNDLLGDSFIVLIDEIDLHLHPKWQRRIVPALRETFPNCQFIITTHSPQVIGEVPADKLFLLKRDTNGNIVCSKPKRSKGLTSSEVLIELMGVRDINPDVASKLKDIYRFIAKEEFEKARELIGESKAELGQLPALIEALTVLELSE